MREQQLKETTEFLKGQIEQVPDVGLVLGSGLGTLAAEIEDAVTIPYEKIPHFPVSTVEGHAGHLVVGRLGTARVLAMQGRFHYYEGYSMDEVTYPIRVMRALGVETLFVTNAAGGLRQEWGAGTLMLITDHIFLMGEHPLSGPNLAQWGPRFPDMSEAYSKRLQEIARQVADEQGVALQAGVYAGLTGPSYETPAEIRMLKFLGADAVGMSTVPEVIVARHSGMDVVGISCITNPAAGLFEGVLSHEEVMETTRRVNADFAKLVKGILNRL